MMEGTLKVLGMAALLAGWNLQLMAGNFTPPAEGPVPFRRDKVPLDVDAMQALSRQVENLARGLQADTAAARRGAAQMLALALALDPENDRVPRLVEAFHEGKRKAEADTEQLERSRTRIWQVITWLESPEAGADGRLLAACLQDVMVIADPNHPKSASFIKAGEQGAWAGWVPALAAYEPAATVKNDPPVKESVKPADVPTVSGQPPLLEKASLQAVLWKKSGSDDAVTWTLGPDTLEMTAAIEAPAHREESKESVESKTSGESQASEEPPKFAVRIGQDGESSPLASTSRRITRLLSQQHKDLPAGLKIRISSKHLDESVAHHRRQAVGGPCAVLASAAITGIVPDAIVIGEVDENGAFVLPATFWKQLQALGKGSGKRLVLPMEAATVLPSVLALENPGFFMEYEVLLAQDFKQLLELSAKTPEPSLAAPMARFAEIRDRMGNQDVRLYIGNTHVKQRLLTLLEEAPYHFSARALFIQASGKRPTLVVRSVLAAELLNALEPLRWIGKSDDGNVTAVKTSQINALYDQCKSRVDRLARYTEKSDQAMFDLARDALDGIRDVERATRTRDESWKVEQIISSARRSFGRLYQTFADVAGEATGEAPRNSGN